MLNNAKTIPIDNKCILGIVSIVMIKKNFEISTQYKI